MDGTANDGAILSMPITGGTPVTLVDDLDNPAKLAVDGNTLYFTSNVVNGAVLSTSTGGGTITTLASGLDYPYAIAVAGGLVYFTTENAVAEVQE
jgi:hypothetical protein